MQKRRYQQFIALGVMCGVSLGPILASQAAEELAAGAFKGTAADITGLNGDLYQVKELHTLDDGNYVVYAAAKGFSSEVETAVIFDEKGGNILNLTVISQEETPGVGSKVTEDSFLSQFHNMAAPVKVSDLEAVSPAAGSEGESQDLADEDYDPAQWNPEDESPEASAMRTLYKTGMLKSSAAGEKLRTPFSDLSPEEQAAAKLEQAGLLEGKEEIHTGETVQATEADAVSGATISSKAVAATINNGYFFLNEEVLK